MIEHMRTRFMLVFNRAAVGRTSASAVHAPLSVCVCVGCRARAHFRMLTSFPADIKLYGVCVQCVADSYLERVDCAERWQLHTA